MTQPEHAELKAAPFEFLGAPGRAVRDGVELAAEGIDADKALDAYLRTGEGAFLELTEPFAIVIWDRRSEGLLAARDPLGVMPLFCAETADGVLFSSSLDALADDPRVSSALNRAALADHLCNRWPDPAETYYEAIRRVPPGHVRRGRELSRYWNPAPPHRPVKWIEADELDRFDTLMEQAVARPMGGGPAGIFLSGGLDSVSVAAVAADYSRREGLPDPLALSVAFPHVEANEETVQKGVAHGLGLRQVMLDFQTALDGKGLLEAALEIGAGRPAPLANVWWPVYHPLAAEGVSRGCTAILTGGGGDEWLSVSPFLAADLLRAGDLRGLYRLWSTMHRSYRLSRLATLRSVLWTFSTKPVLAAAAERRTPAALAAYRRRTRRKLTPDWVAPDPELRQEILERAYATATQPATQGFYLREGQLSLDHALVSMEMEELFESGRRVGVPIRMPFWDADLVDFLYRTPPEILAEGNRAKGLVRRMLDARFPELGFGRHKKVLATNYFVKVVLEEGPTTWRTMKGPFALESAGVVDGARLNLLVEKVFEGEQLTDVSKVWNLMSLEAWVRSRLMPEGR